MRKRIDALVNKVFAASDRVCPLLRDAIDSMSRVETSNSGVGAAKYLKVALSKQQAALKVTRLALKDTRMMISGDKARRKSGK